MAKSILDTFTSNARSAGLSAKFSKASISWFNKNIKKAAQIKSNQKKMLKDPELTQATEVKIGKMYLYRYDPKTKKDLPYYDTLPLIIPIEQTATGFLALNFHYLPPILRAQLLSKLMDVSNNKKFNKSTRLKVTYDLLRGARRFKAFEPCIKQYLLTHIKSKVLEVPPAHWESAIWLPFDNFVGAGRMKVWNDSKKSIGK